MARKARKPADLAAKAAESAVGSEQSAVETQTPAGESGEVVQTEAPVDTIVDGVVELSNGVDAGPARSMADDLKDIAGAAGAAPPLVKETTPQAMFDLILRAFEQEAENHPQGQQGCMVFTPTRDLPLAVEELVDNGVWKRCDESAMWQFWIESGAIVKMVRTDMIHLREAPENVRELAA